LCQNYLIQSWDELEIKTQSPRSERLIDLTYDKFNNGSINGFQSTVDVQEDNGRDLPQVEKMLNNETDKELTFNRTSELTIF